MKKNIALSAPKPPKLIKPKQITSEYGVAYTTVRDAVHRGEMPVIRLGNGRRPGWYLERADVEQWLASKKETLA